MHLITLPFRIQFLLPPLSLRMNFFRFTLIPCFFISSCAREGASHVWRQTFHKQSEISDLLWNRPILCRSKTRDIVVAAESTCRAFFFFKYKPPTVVVFFLLLLSLPTIFDSGCLAKRVWLGEYKFGCDLYTNRGGTGYNSKDLGKPRRKNRMLYFFFYLFIACWYFLLNSRCALVRRQKNPVWCRNFFNRESRSYNKLNFVFEMRNKSQYC